MRWRYIAWALVGGLLGFTGQFIADLGVDIRHFCFGDDYLVVVPSNIAPPYPDGPPYDLLYKRNGRIEGTPYRNEKGTPVFPKALLAMEFHPSSEQSGRWQQLWYQLVFLDWLRRNGNVGFRAAEVGALLGVSLVLAADRCRRRQKARKEALSV